ncbi:unnamed protein product, partial [Amoebophrya sp. A120]
IVAETVLADGRLHAGRQLGLTSSSDSSRKPSSSSVRAEPTQMVSRSSSRSPKKKEGMSPPHAQMMVMEEWRNKQEQRPGPANKMRPAGEEVFNADKSREDDEDEQLVRPEAAVDLTTGVGATERRTPSTQLEGMRSTSSIKIQLRGGSSADYDEAYHFVRRARKPNLNGGPSANVELAVDTVVGQENSYGNMDSTTLAGVYEGLVRTTYL